MWPRKTSIACLALLLALPLLVVSAAPASARESTVVDGYEVTLKAVVSKPGSVTVRVEVNDVVYRKVELGQRFGPQRRFRVTAITLPPCAAFDYRHARVRDDFALCVR